jgi:hypothetical protein
VDTFGGVLLALAGDGTVTKRRLDRAIGALRPRAGGGMVVALERRFALTGPGDEEPRRLEELWDTPGVHPRPAGRGRDPARQLATRNVADFDGAGIEIIDPWLPSPG